MSDREAMQMALEALEMTYSVATNQWQAITALRARLKQPEQKQHQPWCDSVTKLLLSNPPQIPPCNCKQEPEQQQAEPVAWIVDGGKKSGQLLYTHEYELELVAPKIMCKPLYTHPTQRKPLTLKELAELYLKHTDRPMKAHWEFARAIEQAHGIKETP